MQPKSHHLQVNVLKLQTLSMTTETIILPRVSPEAYQHSVKQF